ncbi:4'-phosphopantetheinyl transferase family protein [Marichromatium purpuratum]|nr:4'-phosphopantetheinyl transferase superfamily protein [Marichromatium purpuratum]
MLNGDWRRSAWVELASEMAAGLDQPLVVLAPIAPDETVLSPWLTAAEWVRCARYRQAADRRRCVSAHALKRRVLSALLGCAPHALRFVCDAYGKPRLVANELAFNLSHAGDWVALACAPQGMGPIGVDLEQPSARIADPVEIGVWHPEDRLLPAVSGEQAFYTAWTLKEAIAKGIGVGLGVGFETLALQACGDNRYQCHHQGRCWSARHHDVEGGVHLALACPRPWPRARWLQLECSLAQTGALAVALPR